MVREELAELNNAGLRDNGEIKSGHVIRQRPHLYFYPQPITIHAMLCECIHEATVWLNAKHFSVTMGKESAEIVFHEIDEIENIELGQFHLTSMPVGGRIKGGCWLVVQSLCDTFILEGKGWKIVTKDNRLISKEEDTGGNEVKITFWPNKKYVNL